MAPALPFMEPLLAWGHPSGPPTPLPADKPPMGWVGAEGGTGCTDAAGRIASALANTADIGGDAGAISTFADSALAPKNGGRGPSRTTVRGGSAARGGLGSLAGGVSARAGALRAPVAPAPSAACSGALPRNQRGSPCPAGAGSAATPGKAAAAASAAGTTDGA